jgi:UDPglucose--hexose-1-phosphate uridylyltransferase
VVIESPDHSRPLAHHSVEQVAQVLSAIQLRLRALMDDARLKAIVVFKNHGHLASASMAHPHWQIVATPIVPERLRLAYAIAREHFAQASKCLTCQLLEDELVAGTRVLFADHDHVVLLPFASSVPYHCRVLPRRHESSIAALSPTRLRSLAVALLMALRPLDQRLSDPSFNLTLTTLPHAGDLPPVCHWHLDILPRLAHWSGFELGSGMLINTILPEDGASFLRSA